MSGDNTGVYRIDRLFLIIKTLRFAGTITRPVVIRPSTSHTKSELSAFIPYIASSPPTQ